MCNIMIIKNMNSFLETEDDKIMKKLRKECLDLREGQHKERWKRFNQAKILRTKCKTKECISNCDDIDQHLITIKEEIRSSYLHNKKCACEWYNRNIILSGMNIKLYNMEISVNTTIFNSRIKRCDYLIQKLDELIKSTTVINSDGKR